MADEEIVNPYDGLSKPWQKFFKRFEEIEDMKVSQWKDVHVLAYICKRYEDVYKQKFSVTIKGAPTKSPDMYMVKRIRASLNTTDMRQIKEYIDWVYDTIIIPKRTKFRKIGFFLTPGLANDFAFYKRNKKDEYTRSDKVPDTYSNIADELGVTISTFGDLAFIKMAVDAGNGSEEHATLLGNLELLGLDLDSLKDMQ